MLMPFRITAWIQKISNQSVGSVLSPHIVLSCFCILNYKTRWEYKTLWNLKEKKKKMGVLFSSNYGSFVFQQNVPPSNRNVFRQMLFDKAKLCLISGEIFLLEGKTFFSKHFCLYKCESSLTTHTMHFILISNTKCMHAFSNFILWYGCSLNF